MTVVLWFVITLLWCLTIFMLVFTAVQRRESIRRMRETLQRLPTERAGVGANQRAQELFESLVTPKQAQDARVFGEFTVKGSNGRKYRIVTRVTQFNVETKRHRLCAALDESYKYPVMDAIIAQYLMIVTDADKFEKIANRSSRY